MDIKIYLDLFFTFFKIGMFTLGGGYALLPVIQTEMVDRRKWLTDEEFTDFSTLSQSIPGVISINLSTCVGMKLKGTKGAVIATLGIILPALLSILAVASVYTQMIKNMMIQDAFKGVRAAVVAFVLYAIIRLSKTSVKSKFQFIIFLVAFIISMVFDGSAPFIIVASGLICALLKPIK